MQTVFPFQQKDVAVATGEHMTVDEQGCLTLCDLCLDGGDCEGTACLTIVKIRQKTSHDSCDVFFVNIINLKSKDKHERLY